MTPTRRQRRSAEVNIHSFFNLGARWVGGKRHATDVLPPEMFWYPFYRWLGGSQHPSGRVRKISPPTGIRSPDRPSRKESVYRPRYLGRMEIIPLKVYNIINTYLRKRNKKRKENETKRKERKEKERKEKRKERIRKRKGPISVTFANLPSHYIEANFNMKEPFPTTHSLSNLFLPHPTQSLEVCKQHSIKLRIAD